MDKYTMNNTYEYLKRSLQKAISLAGNMRKLAEERDMDYSTINRFNSGDNAIENMPLKTMMKLFPELKTYCFLSDIPQEVHPPTVSDGNIRDCITPVL